MGTPPGSSGLQLNKGMIHQYTSHETDKLALKATNGIRSNKYKPVDYDKLKALAAEKKFSSHKTLLKVKKIEQMSKQSKENTLLKQHKLIWQKEFIRLNNLRKRLQGEIELHRRENVNDGGLCSNMYQEFENFEISLDSDFSSFKEKTVEPVWNLRDDLQFWIQENMQDLRLGSPDVVSKHQEINSTVQNVKHQQNDILEKLYHEQICLEQELQIGELAELSHGNPEYKIEIEQGIPEEAFDLECYDMDLKVTVLQEFIIIDERFRQRLHALEDEHAKILRAGRHGGWDEDEHFLFVAVYEQYPHEMPNRRKLIMDRLKRHFPKKSRSELVSHEDWMQNNRYFLERKHVIKVGWQKAREGLYFKAKSTFVEADLAAKMAEHKAEEAKKRKEISDALYEKVRLWREQKMESIMLQQKIHEQKMEEMQEKLKMEEERDRKKREEDKLLVQKFYEERNKKRREQEAKYEARLEELKKVMEEQAKYDKERVAYREQQIVLRNEEKERKKEEIEEEKREVERRLEALRQQVRVVAESDPERLVQKTQAWQNRLAGEEEDINIQKPLFDITGFTAKQITSDPRLKLEQRLREAGLHNSDYARHVLANVAPPQPPRRDMESNVFKNNNT